MGTINQFTAKIGEVARPKLFDVTIFPPGKFLGPAGGKSGFLDSKGLEDLKSVATDFNFKCESTNIPGRTFATTEQKFGSNPTEKHAYHTTYNDIDMTIIVTESGKENRGLREKRFFDAWMNYINPTTSYDFIYKQDYVGQITIKQYNSSGDEIFACTLLDAFPISVNQLDLDWSSDGYHKLNVTFAYTRWIA